MVFEYSSWSWAGGEITKRLRPVNYAGTEPIGFTLTIRLHTRGCVIHTDLNLQNLDKIHQHQFVAQFFHFSIQQTFDTIILSSNTNPDLLLRNTDLFSRIFSNKTQPKSSELKYTHRRLLLTQMILCIRHLVFVAFLPQISVI